MPAARSVGPVMLSATASSAEMYPMPLVRPIQMRFSVSSVSYSSTRLGIIFRNRSIACRQPADSNIAGHHPLAGEQFENLQNLFALAKTVKKYRHRAEIDRVRPQPDQMRRNPLQLHHHHADVLRAFWNFQP